MRTALAAAALLLAFHANAQGLSAGPERLLAPPSFGPGYGQHFPMDLASDGTDHLALWIDQTESRDGLWAAVVDERGETRPLPSVRLARNGQINNVHAVWTGDAYLVVWRDLEQGVVAARVSRDAELLGAPVTIASTGNFPRSLAWNGRSALLLSVYAAELRAITFSPEGVIERTVILPAKTQDFVGVAEAADGMFVVTWVETFNNITAGGFYAPTSAVKTMRLDGTGASVDAEPSTLIAELPSSIAGLSAASDGERVGIAFVVQRPSVEETNWLRTYTVEPRTNRLVAHTIRKNVTREPEVIATSRGFLAGMMEWEGDTLLLRLYPFEDELAKTFVLSERMGGSDLRLSASSRSVMAVWSAYEGTSRRNLIGRALDPAATAPLTGTVPVSISAVMQRTPSIEPAGEQSLVTWVDLTAMYTGNLMGLRVDRSGNPIDAEPFVIATGVNAYPRPKAAFTGELWLVAWHDVAGTARTQIARVALDGRVLPGREELTSWDFDLASNGRFTVLAVRGTVVRFSRSGEKIDVTEGVHQGYTPAIASNGREFLLVWTEGSDWWQFPSPNWRGVHAIRLDEEGIPFGGRFDVANGPLDEGDAMVASDGRDFLVAYHYEKSAVHAKRVLREGVLGDTTATGQGMVVAQQPNLLAVARKESGYVVAVASEYPPPHSINAVPVDAKGSPTGPPLLIAHTESVFPNAALAWNGGTVLMAYPRSIAGPPFENIERVFVRTLSSASMRRRAVR